MFVCILGNPREYHFFLLFSTFRIIFVGYEHVQGGSHNICSSITCYFLLFLLMFTFIFMYVLALTSDLDVLHSCIVFRKKLMILNLQMVESEQVDFLFSFHLFTLFFAVVVLGRYFSCLPLYLFVSRCSVNIC